MNPRALLLLCSLLLPAAATAGESLRATYSLLLNGELVGQVYLKLLVDDAARYHLDMFTVPAGKMAGEETEEILETSAGTTGPDWVRPERFDYSLRTPLATSLLAQVFDWDGGRLLMHSDSDSAELALQPDSQDRISYILRARQLAQAGAGSSADIAIVGLDATVHSTLKVVAESGEVATGLGRMHARQVLRTESANAGERRLWFAPDAAYAPVLIEHSWQGGAVRMRLETLHTETAEAAAAGVSPG